MKLIFYCILTYIFICTTRSLIYKNLNSNVLSLIRGDRTKQEKSAIKRAAPHKHQTSYIKDQDESTDEKAHFRIDPVLNFVRRHGKEPKISRRKDSSTSQDSTSSSREFQDWKDEWREHWIHKKFEAVNSSYVPGDTVNMVGARPWGVPCGDPNQHDMPWGTCMLPMECDAEYRIYRGDYFCGRTQFVCCSLQLTVYDMYQGFDPSFEDTDIATDTEEKRVIGAAGSKENKKKSKQNEKHKRKNTRKKRKRLIERQIKKIQKVLKKIISRQERNASAARKRKTRQLKKFVEMLKKQYRKDRKLVMDLHESEMIKIDDVLKNKLEQISVLNENFVKNATFRDIIVNGTLNRQAARMLVEAYPELQSYININVRRRSGSPVKDYLDYDVEYGMLYY